MIIVGVVTWYACGGNEIFVVKRDRKKPHYFEGLDGLAPEPGMPGFDNPIPAPPVGGRDQHIEALIHQGKLEEAVEICVNPHEIEPAYTLEARQQIGRHYLRVIDELNRKRFSKN